MPGAQLVAGSRGTFISAAKLLTLAPPAAAHPGDVMIALVAHNAADARGATPAGWTNTDNLGSGADVLDVYVRMVDVVEPPAVVFALSTVANEWQGEFVAVRGATPGVLREASATATFAATTVLATATVAVQQAINLILAVWTCTGAPGLTLPAGFTPIDSFATAEVSSRSMLVGQRIAGATGIVASANAVAGTNTTGRSFCLSLRDRAPVVPLALVDVVPGNIGLLGKDTRRAR